MTIPLPDDICRDHDHGPFDGPWLAHEHPEHPLDQWCWLCDCAGCLIALRATARRRPRLALGLKTHRDRIAVTAELASTVWARDGTLTPLLHDERDRIREVFVVAGAVDLPLHYDWASLAARRAARPRSLRVLADFVRAPDR